MPVTAEAIALAKIATGWNRTFILAPCRWETARHQSEDSTDCFKYLKRAKGRGYSRFVTDCGHFSENFKISCYNEFEVEK